MVPDLEPMLANRGLPSGDLGCWAVEPKLDGWRVTVLADPAFPAASSSGPAGVTPSPRRSPGSTPSDE